MLCFKIKYKFQSVFPAGYIQVPESSNIRYRQKPKIKSTSKQIVKPTWLDTLTPYS